MTTAREIAHSLARHDSGCAALEDDRACDCGAYDQRDAIESALLAERRRAIEGLSQLSLVVKLQKIVDGWGETRHPKALGFGNYGSRTGLTCGDVYELTDLVRSLSPSSPRGDSR